MITVINPIDRLQPRDQNDVKSAYVTTTAILVGKQAIKMANLLHSGIPDLQLLGRRQTSPQMMMNLDSGATARHTLKALN